jgi:hypothetical protein
MNQFFSFQKWITFFILFCTIQNPISAFAGQSKLKIPAKLLTRIFTTNHSFPQIVRIEVLEDVYEPKGVRLLIHKGAVGVGLTDSESLNENKGIMDIVISEILDSTGKRIHQDFIVGSADGNIGLRGQIFDMKGNHLVGSSVPQFTSAVSNWFSMNSVTQFSNLIKNNPPNSLNFKEVDVKLATKIFFVPKDIPIILYFY